MTALTREHISWLGPALWIRRLKNRWRLITVAGTAAGMLGVFITLSASTITTGMTIRIEQSDAAPASIETEAALMRSWDVVSHALASLERDVTVTPHVSMTGLRLRYAAVRLMHRLHGTQPPAFIDFVPRVGLSRFVITGNPEQWEGMHFTLQISSEDFYRIIDPEGNVLAEGEAGQSMDITLPSRNEETPSILSIRVERIRAEMGQEFSIIPLNHDHYVQQQIERIAISTTGKTGLMHVRFHSADPYFAVTFLRSLSESYLSQAYDRASLGKLQALGRMQMDYELRKARLSEADGMLADFKLKHPSFSSGQVIDLIASRSSEMEENLRTLQEQQAELMAISPSRKLSIQALQQQIDALQARKIAIAADAVALPELERKYAALRRDINFQERALEWMTESITKLASDVQALSSYARIISPVMVLSDRVLYGMARGFTGGFALVAFAYAFALLIPIILCIAKLQDASEIKAISGLPLTTEFPKLLPPRSKRRRKGPHPDALDDTHYLKALTSLYQQMRRIYQHKCPVFVFTASQSAQGASTAAMHFATLAAGGGVRTLLIDANVLRPALHKALSTHHSSIVLESDKPAETPHAMVQSTELPNLSLISAGDADINEKLAGDEQQWKEFLATFTPHYGMIVIDFPAMDGRLYRYFRFHFASAVIFCTRRGANLYRLAAFLRAVESGAARNFYLAYTKG